MRCGVRNDNDSVFFLKKKIACLSVKVCTKAVETILSGVNIKIISQVLNRKFLVFQSYNQSLDKDKKHIKISFFHCFLS